ncbi:MAG TPA: DUF4166 domain-containing protein [Myxococcota bacterium]|nr:DUF4166 domain-containing protein [Myxococcota bacterium]
MHTDGDAAGLFTVEHGWFGLARLFGFPPAGEGIPVHLRIRSLATRWERDFDGVILRSRQRLVQDGSHWWLGEVFEGQSLELWMRLEAYTNGLKYVAVGGKLWGVKIPIFPRVEATVRGDIPGRVKTDVEIRLPLIGRLVRYAGWLEVVPPEDEEE